MPPKVLVSGISKQLSKGLFKGQAVRSQQPFRCFSLATRLAQDAGKQERMTSFGYQEIPESEKEAKVGHVFSSVASKYDSMNDFMSLGIHRLWKDYFVRSLNPGTHLAASLMPNEEPKGWNILDVAGGTGDIAFRMLNHASYGNNDFKTKVTVLDINQEMLEEGKKRAMQTDWAGSNRLSFVQGNAENMPQIPDNSIDLYTVAFGIRNMTHKQAALDEAFRVLKPGGTFACLEFSKVQWPIFNAIYKRWSFGAIPIIGQIWAGDRDSYQYLVESIDKFPSQAEFKNMILKAGFVVSNTKPWDNLTGGIAAIHKGVKPKL